MITIKRAGDAALLFETSQPVHPGHQGGNEAAWIAAAIRAADVPGVIDVVPGASTVLVTFGPSQLQASGEPETDSDLQADGGLATGELIRQVLQRHSDASAIPAGLTEDPIVIDTVYDGVDLADVAALTGLTVPDVIARHQAAEYQVGWLGFSPGFGYLTGLDPRLAVPRLDSPRQTVPAGSVAIAGGLAAVYPAPSPGGWRLIGRTAAVLWDPDRDPPALFTPGQRVRFRAVGRLPDKRPPLCTDLERPDQDKGTGPAHKIRERSRERWVEVVRPGPLTTIQDLGRAGLAHLGVPASGAADAGSLRLANELVGNDEGAACLEVTLGRLELRFGFDAAVALAGAPAPVRLIPAAGTGPAHETAFAVPAGTALRLGAPPTGLRSYLAISGGIDVPPVLGSRSADLLSGLGPAPLRPGDRLRVGRARSRPVSEKARRPRTAGPSAAAQRPGAPPQITETVLRVIRGPRDDWFSEGAISALAGESYQVTAASNRSGLRLAGPPLHRERRDELPSEGVAAGSLQVSHDGQPILLLADRPTTGGYPVIGVVVSADLDVAAQLRPGQRVRFQLVAP
ncbi:MAG TPA: urea amidolyase family protein [Streptosporangiaceae bacterium]|nr:urea amidolyase family protein [Streptosporangiaceae bacterium]